MANHTEYCDKCGGFIHYDKSIQLTSMPPKYKGECGGCKKVFYAYCHKID